jgi:hypothetical protein
MTDGERCRALWAQVEADGFFPVRQVVQAPQWTLLVAVPWCRFAREVSTETQYRQLLDTLRRTPKAPIEVKSPETQLQLFGDPA